MTDKELLELAAKAANYELASTKDGYPLWRNGVGIWNPLTDDGDALRLAVKLFLCVEFGYCKDDAPIVMCGQIEERQEWPINMNFPDPCAATRRAIVRAAAKIGKTL